MTKAQDVRELIAEQSAGPAARRQLESVAALLETTLSRDVPYRPAFKAELRRQLLSEARRRLMPWYRRPAVWGSAVAMVATVALVAAGLRFWQSGTGPSPVQSPPVTQGPVVDPHRPSGGGEGQPHLVNYLNLPVEALADEPLAAGQGPEPQGRVQPGAALTVYLVTPGRGDLSLFRRVADGLGLQGEPQALNGGFQLVAGNRRLWMGPDGQVVFTDAGPFREGTPVDESGVRSVAQHFLEKAALPVPSLDPVVTETRVEDRRIFAVTYTPRAGGRPIVNARTVVEVDDRGHVRQARAWPQTTLEEKGAYAAVAWEEAVRQATARGGSFKDADLVYVRTRSGEAVFLQPYWRVYGVDGQGRPVVRYVPALVR
jgi:hypothetical protein